MCSRPWARNSRGYTCTALCTTDLDSNEVKYLQDALELVESFMRPSTDNDDLEQEQEECSHSPEELLLCEREGKR